MSGRTLFDNLPRPRIAPHEDLPPCCICRIPGSGCWGDRGTFWCTEHRPAEFLDLAREHSRQVRGEGRRTAA